MAWTAPATATSSQVVTPAYWNAQIPANFLEQDAAVVTTAGDLVYADAANSMGSRLAIGAAGSVLAADTTPMWGGIAQTIGDALYLSRPTVVSLFFPFDDPLIWGNGDDVTVQTDVAVTLTTGTRAMVWFGARYVSSFNIGTNVQLSYEVTGATTISASTAFGTLAESDPAGTLRPTGRAHYATSLTPGVNTFTLQGAMTGTTGGDRVGSPWIIVLAL